MRATFQSLFSILYIMKRFRVLFIYYYSFGCTTVLRQEQFLLECDIFYLMYCSRRTLFLRGNIDRPIKEGNEPWDSFVSFSMKTFRRHRAESRSQMQQIAPVLTRRR